MIHPIQWDMNTRKCNILEDLGIGSQFHSVFRAAFLKKPDFLGDCIRIVWFFYLKMIGTPTLTSLKSKVEKTLWNCDLIPWTLVKNL